MIVIARYYSFRCAGEARADGETPTTPAVRTSVAACVAPVYIYFYKRTGFLRFHACLVTSLQTSATGDHTFPACCRHRPIISVGRRLTAACSLRHTPAASCDTFRFCCAGDKMF